ncbi:MAG TPA: DUF4920 domain-containing protein [Pyrinomonadaceae bacterium]|nr:DUF4920 domain-containing protein [Chloracidobacterium sp.]MBP9936395.1 DUF4920 domain-containing protein [Pyrinomonadaceae bacterium]MBK9438455.1 DUF4920 domain-containing protein [Chloracidobacterium sp.]MBL0240665.1 DUF4920 domain-containing protein [Chloracidobacterium sp.]HQX56880.1 DUF4920 domain-containing protein [Pyrinomonadaceae bacterium]
MKKLIALIGLFAAFTFSAMGQESAKAATPTDKDKTEAIPSDGYLKRGTAIGNSKKVSLNKLMKDPAKFTGKTVRIEGVVVRSCKSEGCWAEVAENKESKSLRIKMKDHSFFIPLESAGSSARIEGTVAVKTLSKAQVDHMIEEDGAKFDNRNADGTVVEVSFEATGIELKKATK